MYLNKLIKISLHLLKNVVLCTQKMPPGESFEHLNNLSKHNLNIYEYTKYSSSLQGEITAPVAIRDGHSTDANVVLANVAVGNTFTAIGYCPTSPNWLYIKLSNGATGFISRLNTNIPANS